MKNLSPSPIPSATDVLIVGGGLAGASTALSIRRHADCSVLLVDAGDYRGFRVGESIPPTVRSVLAELNAEEALTTNSSLPCRGVSSAWSEEHLAHHDYMVGLEGDGWHLDRSRFDAEIARIAQDTGVVVCTKTRASQFQQATDGTWSVSLKPEGGADSVVKARFLVDATGRRATVARQLGASWHRFDGLIAVVGRYKSEQSIPSRVVIEACPNGWWYTAPIPGNEIVVSWMSDADLVRQDGMHHSSVWEQAWKETGYIHELVGSARQEMSPRIFPAGSWLLAPSHGSGWLAVGDASACFDPLSSTGVLEALRSGMLAGEAIHRWWNGGLSSLEHYTERRRQEFEHYLVEREKVYSRVLRYRDEPFWRRRNRRQINLDPQSCISVPDRNTLYKAVGSRLTRPEREAISQMCEESHHAYEIATRLVQDGGWQNADYRIISGIQELIEQNVLTIRPTKRS